MSGAVPPLPHMCLHDMYSVRFHFYSSCTIIIKLSGKSVPLMHLFHLKVKSFYDCSSLHVSAVLCVHQWCIVWLSSVWKDIAILKVYRNVIKTVYVNINIQIEHKVFPWLQTFITRKLLYVEYKHIYIYIYIYIFFSKCDSRSFFCNTLVTSTCAPFCCTENT